MQLSQSVEERSLVAVVDDGARVRRIRVRAAEHGADESEGSRHHANGIDRDHDTVSSEIARFSTTCQ